jgi:hypothetical protein
MAAPVGVIPAALAAGAIPPGLAPPRTHTLTAAQAKKLWDELGSTKAASKVATSYSPSKFLGTMCADGARFKKEEHEVTTQDLMHYLTSLRAAMRTCASTLCCNSTGCGIIWSM